MTPIYVKEEKHEHATVKVFIEEEVVKCVKNGLKRLSICSDDQKKSAKRVKVQN